jgi:hypothetical protein
VTGIGIGSTIAPSMAAALQALSGPEIPRGTSVLNSVRRIAGAIDTAAFAILPQHFARDQDRACRDCGQANAHPGHFRDAGRRPDTMAIADQ